MTVTSTLTDADGDTDDIYVIDDSEFYIRGILPVPVVDSDDEFRWGLDKS